MSKIYTEKAREIPVAGEYDVIVIGSGPAGVSAAITSAREGMKTLLIEQSGDVGGISTAGLMSHWTGNTKGGIYDEIIEKSKDFRFGNNNKDRINPEMLKTVLLQMIEDAKVSLRLYTFACEVIMEDKTIKGIICESKSGRQAFMSKIVIDASGDGDIGAKAGAPYFVGKENDGRMQPVTIMFKVGGVDFDNAVFPCCFEETFQVPKGDLQSLGKEHLPFPAGHVLLYKSTLPGIVTCNMTNCININGTNTDDLTKATVICRKQMTEIVKFLREYTPGFENCYMISSASLIGVRETRHFKGEKTITEQDITQARVFDDWAVTKAHFTFDVHNLSGSGLDETGVQREFKQTKGYTIPYGCFVPLEIENLFIAGRCISGTHMAFSNFRAMPICANMGQSVGVAASLCVRNNVMPRNLEISLLQNRLKEIGIEP